MFVYHLFCWSWPEDWGTLPERWKSAKNGARGDAGG